MKKIYLIPLFMLLLTTGYANESQQAPIENVAKEEIVQTPDAEKDVSRQTAAPNRTHVQSPDTHHEAGPSGNHGNGKPDARTRREQNIKEKKNSVPRAEPTPAK